MPNGFFRILSIDGGGIRGILPGQVMVALEEKLRVASGREDVRVADYFDLIAGTSTGGILTCFYLCPDDQEPPRPRFRAAEAVDLYLKRGGKIFSIPVEKLLTSLAGLADEKYPAKPLEKELRERLGELKLSQLLKPCLVTAYDIEKRCTVFFTQHTAMDNPQRDFLVRDVARATSAAPTFFEVAHVKPLGERSEDYYLVDGGVFANNPALCAYAEARNKYGVTAKDMVILSISTGKVKKKYPYKKAKDWGPLSWAAPIIDIMMTGVGETVDFQLKWIFESVDCSGQYIRLDPPLGGADDDMDDVRPKNLDALRDAGAAFAAQKSAELDRIVELLTQQV